MRGPLEWKGCRFLLFHARCNAIRRYTANQQLRQGLSYPSSDPTIETHVEAKLPCQGCGGQSTAYISFISPILFVPFSGIPSRSLLLSLQAIRSLPSLVLVLFILFCSRFS